MFGDRQAESGHLSLSAGHGFASDRKRVSGNSFNIDIDRTAQHVCDRLEEVAFLAQLQLEPSHRRVVDALELELRSMGQLAPSSDLRLFDEVIRLQVCCCRSIDAYD
jgi:hypothetical protein